MYVLRVPACSNGYCRTMLSIMHHVGTMQLEGYNVCMMHVYVRVCIHNCYINHMHVDRRTKNISKRTQSDCMPWSRTKIEYNEIALKIPFSEKLTTKNKKS